MAHPKPSPLWRWSQEPHLSLIHATDCSVAFSICNNCGLVRQTPFLPDNTIKKLYTEINLEAQYTDFEERYRWLCLALGKEPEAGHLLDVGCSEGKQAQLFLNLGWKVSGIEPSLEAAQKAIEKGIQVYQCPAQDVEFDTGQFDLVIFFHLLEHLKNPRDFIHKMANSLKGGGLIYLEVPNLLRPWGNLTFFFPAFSLFRFWSRSH